MIFELIVIFILLFIIIGLVYQFMYDIYGWVLSLSLIFYISYSAVKLVYYFRKKKEGQIKEEEPKDKYMVMLKDFIQKNIKQGFKAEQIKEALLKEGWPKEKVEKAFK